MTNCVYIFGNGFDIRMGMPTSYPDFLKYYQNIKAPNDSIISIKEMFLSKVKEEKGEHWKDLEVALGLFTNEFSNKQLFKSFYRDINIELRKYLIQVEKNIPFFPIMTEISFGRTFNVQNIIYILILRNHFLMNLFLKTKLMQT